MEGFMRECAMGGDGIETTDEDRLWVAIRVHEGDGEIVLVGHGWSMIPSVRQFAKRCKERGRRPTLENLLRPDDAEIYATRLPKSGLRCGLGGSWFGLGADGRFHAGMSRPLRSTGSRPPVGSPRGRIVCLNGPPRGRHSFLQMKSLSAWAWGSRWTKQRNRSPHGALRYGQMTPGGGFGRCLRSRHRGLRRDASAALRMRSKRASVGRRGTRTITTPRFARVRWPCHI